MWLYAPIPEDKAPDGFECLRSGGERLTRGWSRGGGGSGGGWDPGVGSGFSLVCVARTFLGLHHRKRRDAIRSHPDEGCGHP